MVVIFTIRINSQAFYGMAKKCIYVFCEDIRINSALFPYVALGDTFFCIVEKYERLLRGAKWAFKYI